VRAVDPKRILKKMVFIGGPRQVGKTTLAISFIKDYIDGHLAYLNWDQAESRSMIQKQVWSKDEPLIIFDELHKRKGCSKYNHIDVAPAFLEFRKKLDIPKWYQVHFGTKKSIIDDRFSILPFETFYKEIAAV